MPNLSCLCCLHLSLAAPVFCTLHLLLSRAQPALPSILPSPRLTAKDQLSWSSRKRRGGRGRYKQACVRSNKGSRRQEGRKGRIQIVRGGDCFHDRFVYEVNYAPVSRFRSSTRLAQSFIPIHFDLNVTKEKSCHLFLPRSWPLSLMYHKFVHNYITFLWEIHSSCEAQIH